MVLFAQAARLPHGGRLKPGHGRGWALNPLASEQCRPRSVEESGHRTFLMPKENGGRWRLASLAPPDSAQARPAPERGGRVPKLVCGVRCPRPPSPAQPSPQPEPLGSDDGPLTLCPYIRPPWSQAWVGSFERPAVGMVPGPQLVLEGVDRRSVAK